jgi:hypothetical protein
VLIEPVPAAKHAKMIVILSERGESKNLLLFRRTEKNY